MQYQVGFVVRYHKRSGKEYKAFVPPCWMLTGEERRQQTVTERRRIRQRGTFARYWAELQQTRLWKDEETFRESIRVPLTGWPKGDMRGLFPEKEGNDG